MRTVAKRHHVLFRSNCFKPVVWILQTIGVQDRAKSVVQTKTAWSR